MFEIYKFEYDCNFITSLDLQSYVNMGILTQADYQKIVGENNEADQATSVQPQA